MDAAPSSMYDGGGGGRGGRQRSFGRGGRGRSRGRGRSYRGRSQSEEGYEGSVESQEAGGEGTLARGAVENGGDGQSQEACQGSTTNGYRGRSDQGQDAYYGGSGYRGRSYRGRGRGYRGRSRSSYRGGRGRYQQSDYRSNNYQNNEISVEDSSMITLCVFNENLDKDCEVTYLRFKKETTKMAEVFKNYAETRNLDLKALQFFLNDKLISEEDTVDSLGITEEKQQIECKYTNFDNKSPSKEEASTTTTATTTAEASLAATTTTAATLSSSNGNLKAKGGLTYSGRTQIPIVCPGHTRPLAEVQFTSIKGPIGESNDADSKSGEKPIDRPLIVSACHDKIPMVRDGTTGDWISSFVGHKGAVWSCKFDPGGLLACTASGDFSVKVWDAKTSEELYEFPHRHIVKSAEFSPDSKHLATVGHEGILRIYNLIHVRNKYEEANADEEKPRNIEPTLSIVQNPDKKVTITKVVWITNTTVVTSDSEGYIKFWDIPSLVKPLNPFAKKFVPGKGMVAESSNDDDAIKPPTEPTRQFQVDAEVRDMELSADKTILTVAAGDHVSFFDLTLKTNGLLHSYKMPIHFREEGGATLHPSNTRFVAGGSDLWVRVFDYATGEELECHKGHHGPIRCLRYAPDGETYATGSEDGTIRIWKTNPPTDSTATQNLKQTYAEGPPKQ